MPIVQPPRGRHVLMDNRFSLLIIIPSQKNIFRMCFLGFWLIGWAIGEISVLGILIGSIFGFLDNTHGTSSSSIPSAAAGGLFFILWLIGWTVGGGFALYAFFWQLTGKEKIEVSNDSVKIRRAIYRFGKISEYLTSHIKGMRVSPVTIGNNWLGWSGAASFWGISGGHLVFDYGSKTIRFGGGVDEAEARQILEEIYTRFPQYQR